MNSMVKKSVATINFSNGDGIVTSTSTNDVLYGDLNNMIQTGSRNDTVTGDDNNDTRYASDAKSAYGGNSTDCLFAGDGIITYTNNGQTNGYITYSDGSILNFSSIEKIIVCFTLGALIATPLGQVPVENLKKGDLVVTKDNGLQEIRWIGRKKITGARLYADPQLTPIVIRKDAFGHGYPERDLILSPQHRVNLDCSYFEEYFGETEQLVSAQSLLKFEGVYRVKPKPTEFIHILFDKHELVLSEGIWTESFHPGKYSLNAVENDQRNELFNIFPELKTDGGLKNYMSARPSLKSFELDVIHRTLGSEILHDKMKFTPY